MEVLPTEVEKPEGEAGLGRGRVGRSEYVELRGVSGTPGGIWLTAQTPHFELSKMLGVLPRA